MKSHLKIATALVNILENKFKIFGFRFGLDPLLGLIPWIGDAIGALVSLYLVWIAIKYNVPREIIFQMFRNIIIDFFLGLFPVIGDIGDFLYRANSKNLKILKQHINIIEGEII